MKIINKVKAKDPAKNPRFNPGIRENANNSKINPVIRERDMRKEARELGSHGAEEYFGKGQV